MIRLLRLTTLVAFLGSTFATLVTLATADIHSGEDAATEAILKRLREACEAYENGDAEYLANFLHPDYTLTNTRGEVTDREQDLAEVRRGDPSYEEFRNHHMKVRIYGDTAVVNGITSLRGTSAGDPFQLDASFTDTLIRQDGRWMLVASHATRLKR